MTFNIGRGCWAAAKKFLRICAFASLLTLGSMGPIHADQPKGCSFIGSWFGFNAEPAMYWTSTANGQNSSEGTYILEVVGFEATLGGAFPTADRVTIGKGFWKRLDGYTFAGSLLVMVVDAEGQTVWVGKLNAVDTLSADCNSMWIETSLEIYMPWQNPFAEDSYFDPITFPGHSGFRMTVDSSAGF
jgi:hypothetical protein